MSLSPGADDDAAGHFGSTKLTRILVVDDLKDITETMGLLFETLGHETTVAADGQQAVDTAAAFEPEIVFMDLDMPVLNGYEAARAIRAAALARQPFLVALTASHGRGRRGRHARGRLRLLPAQAGRHQRAAGAGGRPVDAHAAVALSTRAAHKDCAVPTKAARGYR